MNIYIYIYIYTHQIRNESLIIYIYIYIYIPCMLTHVSENYTNKRPYSARYSWHFTDNYTYYDYLDYTKHIYVQIRNRLRKLVPYHAIQVM